MREFECSMEGRGQHSPLPYVGNISPTMVHVRASVGDLFASTINKEQTGPTTTEKPEKEKRLRL